jgi:hypothetical protein
MVDETMDAPKLYISNLVRAKNEMRKENAKVDKNQKVRQDNFHECLLNIEFDGRLAVRASERSHGCRLTVMASSHS